MAEQPSGSAPLFDQLVEAVKAGHGSLTASLEWDDGHDAEWLWTVEVSIDEKWFAASSDTLDNAASHLMERVRG